VIWLVASDGLVAERFVDEIWTTKEDAEIHFIFAVRLSYGVEHIHLWHVTTPELRPGEVFGSHHRALMHNLTRQHASAAQIEASRCPFSVQLVSSCHGLHEKLL
jgi:hypothetical protein